MFIVCYKKERLARICGSGKNLVERQKLKIQKSISNQEAKARVQKVHPPCLGNGTYHFLL